MRLDPERAAEMGRKSGVARRKLNLDRIERELPNLDSYEHAQERLAIVSNWLAAGLLTGTAGHAFVRCHEIWQKIEESAATFDAIESLRATVKELQGERDRLEQENAQLKLELDRAGVS